MLVTTESFLLQWYMLQQRQSLQELQHRSMFLGVLPESML